MLTKIQKPQQAEGAVIKNMQQLVMISRYKQNFSATLIYLCNHKHVTSSMFFVYYPLCLIECTRLNRIHNFILLIMTTRYCTCLVP